MIRYTLAIAALTVITLPSVKGATLTYELAPANATGSTPWVRAIFSSLATDRVLLRIETTDSLRAKRYMSEIGFSYDLTGDLTILPCDTVLCSGTGYGTAPLPDSIGGGSISPGGSFDLVFAFPQEKSNRFGPSQSAAYLLKAAGMTVQSFDAFSQTNDNKPGFKAYAHVQGYGGSSKIFDNIAEYRDNYSGAYVPEPRAMLLIGSGLLGMGMLARRLRKP